jgi:DNA-directed RNA polymerase specialized sigma24 family protein
MAAPLTTKTKEGVPYIRPPAVERAIDAALAEDDATLVRRAKIADGRETGHMSLEVLVHLIRQAHRDQRMKLRDRLFPILLARCEAVLVRKLPDQHWHLAEEVREEVLGRFAELWAQDFESPASGVLDYFEIRFLDALAAIRVSVVRAEIARTEPLGVPAEKESIRDRRNDEPLPTGDEKLAALGNALSRTPASQGDALELARVLDAVAELPKDEREAFTLVNVLGYDVESDDPEKETAATRCGVTGRTIRNRLRRAAEKLSRFEEKS